MILFARVHLAGAAGCKLDRGAGDLPCRVTVVWILTSSLVADFKSSTQSDSHAGR